MLFRSLNTMLREVLVCGLIAAVSALPQAQSPPPRLAPPLWFLENTLQGNFRARSAECQKLAPSRESESSTGPIFIPEDTDAQICINFPATETRASAWRHDKGGKGACANGCCEFLPPVSKPRPAVDHPSWFVAVNDCSNPTNVNKAPVLFMGKNGVAKTICIEDQETGEYRLDEGALANCGGPCCRSEEHTSELQSP